jgi:hypothetical protein
MCRRETRACVSDPRAHHGGGRPRKLPDFGNSPGNILMIQIRLGTRQMICVGRDFLARRQCRAVHEISETRKKLAFGPTVRIGGERLMHQYRKPRGER